MEHKKKILSLMVVVALSGCASAPDQQLMNKGDDSSAITQSKEIISEQLLAIDPKVSESQKTVDVVEDKVKSVPEKVTAIVEAKKAELVLPTDPNTFLITSEPKTNKHPAFGQGMPIGFLLNGVEGQEVVVTRGDTYTFKVDTGVQHDFYFTTSPKGWGSGTYTDGVEGQFVFKGDVKLSPSSATPDLLYYQCRNHKNMGGKIFVIDKGEDLEALKRSLAAKERALSTGKSKRPKMAATESSVKNKLSYASMVLSSASAKRVEESGNAEAMAILNDARSNIANAKTSLESSDYETAMGQVNEGLRLVTAASRAISTESHMSAVNHKAQYDELVNSLNTYDGSYKRNVERAKKNGEKPSSSLDEGAYNALVTSGKAKAKNGDYAGANKDLNKAQNMITSVLTEMLHAQTITYDKSFDTPKEEYEYELSRAESYEELVPIAIEQKKPSQRALGLIDGFVAKGVRIKSEGKDVAAKGDYKMAIMAMQAATSNFQRALRIAGVN